MIICSIVISALVNFTRVCRLPYVQKAPTRLAYVQLCSLSPCNFGISLQLPLSTCVLINAEKRVNLSSTRPFTRRDKLSFLRLFKGGLIFMIKFCSASVNALLGWWFAPRKIGASSCESGFDRTQKLHVLIQLTLAQSYSSKQFISLHSGSSWNRTKIEFVVVHVEWFFWFNIRDVSSN